jgi:multiple sugar transport system ATP-binding protein
MTMADHVVVMRAGRIEQQGRPLDLYDRPANRFVAGFIGSPAMNILPAVVDGSGRAARLDEPESSLIPLPLHLDPGRSVLVGLRPEHIELADTEAARLDGTVDHVESTGSATFLKVRTAGLPIVVMLARRADVRAGERVGLGFAPTQVHVFDCDTETSLLTPPGIAA